MFVCNIRIMKKLKYCCQHMNYENICLKYMNYEKIKIFLRRAWIMKIFSGIHELCELWIMKTLILKTWKCPFETNELLKNENICLQNMNYEHIKTFICNSWIMKLWKYLFAIHELWNI